MVPSFSRKERQERKERNVIGDDGTWSIEPANEQRLLEVIRKVESSSSFTFSPPRAPLFLFNFSTWP